MSLSKDIQEAINDQIHHEFLSAYVYLAMSAYLEAASLKGFAHWMRIQAKEEVTHAMKLFEYLNDLNGRVELKAPEKPALDFTPVLTTDEHAREHENKVTQLIHSLYEKPTKERDHATQVQLTWFIAEQVEEEATATEV